MGEFLCDFQQGRIAGYVGTGFLLVGRAKTGALRKAGLP